MSALGKGAVSVLAVVAALVVLALYGAHTQGAPHSQSGTASAGQVGLQGTSAAPAATTARPAPVPSDLPGFDGTRQWPLVLLDAAALWSVSDGAGVKVAVVDTGVDAGQRDLMHAIQVIGPPGNDQSDDSHGTIIAGLIAGRGSPSDPDGHVAGLAPHAKIIDVRVTTEAANATAPAIATGIREAVGAKARVINVSLSIARDDPQHDVANAVTFAIQHDCLIVTSAPAGNALNYLGTLPNVLVVGGATMTGQPLVSLLAYRPSAVYAPGMDLESTAEVSKAGQGRRGYITNVTGSDYAAGFVSATAALVLCVDPGLSAGQLRTLIAPPSRTTPGLLSPIMILTTLGFHPRQLSLPGGSGHGQASSGISEAPANSASPSRQGSTRSASASANAGGGRSALPGPSPWPLSSAELIVIIVALFLAVLTGALWRRRGGQSLPASPDPELTATGWEQW